MISAAEAPHRGGGAARHCTHAALSYQDLSGRQLKLSADNLPGQFISCTHSQLSAQIVRVEWPQRPSLASRAKMSSHSFELLNFPHGIAMDTANLDDESLSVQQALPVTLSLDPFSAAHGFEETGINMGIDDDDENAGIAFHPSSSSASPPAASGSTSTGTQSDSKKPVKEGGVVRRR